VISNDGGGGGKSEGFLELKDLKFEEKGKMKKI
jgi:hypothetical protein